MQFQIYHRTLKLLHNVDVRSSSKVNRMFFQSYLAFNYGLLITET